MLGLKQPQNNQNGGEQQKILSSLVEYWIEKYSIKPQKLALYHSSNTLPIHKQTSTLRMIFHSSILHKKLSLSNNRALLFKQSYHNAVNATTSLCFPQYTHREFIISAEVQTGRKIR